MHYTAFVPYSVTAGCSLTSQHSRSTARALLSDHGYLLIQAYFQALQTYAWGFALIQSLSELHNAVQPHRGAALRCDLQAMHPR